MSRNSGEGPLLVGRLFGIDEGGKGAISGIAFGEWLLILCHAEHDQPRKGGGSTVCPLRVQVWSLSRTKDNQSQGSREEVLLAIRLVNA